MLVLRNEASLAGSGGDVQVHELVLHAAPPRIERVVSVTPAGRREYLEVLVPYLLANRHLIDRHIFWLNTTRADDLAYIRSVCARYPDFFACMESSVPVVGNMSIAPFFQHCQDEHTLYIRFDDDICYIADQAIANLIAFRKENPQFFLVFGNIINNSICSFLHQRAGNLPASTPVVQYDCMDAVGWASGSYAAATHREFLRCQAAGSLDKFLFDRWVLLDHNRFSVNCFAWFGRDFKQFGGRVGLLDSGKWIVEEDWLTTYMPKRLSRPNAICGNSLLVHFAFYTQRPYLEQHTGLLADYRRLAAAQPS
jgi:hypothetical protein